MLKKTITYTDYNGVERTEDFYFNLTKAEILEMELSTEGGLQQTIEKIIAAKDLPSLSKYFKKIILMSYGEKSPDGKRFIKNEQLSSEFSQTEAFSQLYVNLATDDVAAADFVNGIIPAEYSQASVGELSVVETTE